MTRRSALAALAFVLSSLPAAADDVTIGSLVIHQPWARATPKGATVGGGYLTIDNKGTVADRLTGGSFAAANGFTLHSMTMDNGVMKMRPAGPVEIPAGGTVTLSPSGLHIMFTGLKRPLRQGETVPGSLDFAGAGTAKVEFRVEGLAAKGPGSGAAGQSMPGMTMQ